MTIGRLVIRALVGALFVGHGTQKLFGWFGGGGPEKTGESFEAGGLRPGRRNALAAGTAEAGGGVLLAAGLVTPLAASMLSGVLLTATRVVHWRNGPWSTNGGYEYPLVLLATLFALTEAGPGSRSLDARLGHERRGWPWALAELGTAAVASQLVIEAGRRRGERARAPVEPAPASEPETLRRAA
jgi:putative oxidoreductase